MIKQVTTTLWYRYEFPVRCHGPAEPGTDIEELEGSYEFHAVDGGTSVVYALRAEGTVS